MTQGSPERPASGLGTANGPGWFWQLLEFFGMTWPGHKAQAAAEAAPRCCACGNPAVQSDGDWRCPHHPAAPLSPPR